MKHSLLLIATALTVGAAQATEQNDVLNLLQVPNVPAPARAAQAYVDPEGTPFDCYLTCEVAGAQHQADRPIQVSIAPDGSSIYFSNLFPSFIPADTEAWAKGEIQADGTINVPVQHIYDYGDVYQLYVCSFDMATMSTYDAQFVINADGSISQADPNSYLMLAALDESGTFLGYITFQTQTLITSQPTEDVRVPASLPEGVEPQTYIYSYTDAYNNAQLLKGQVAFDGSDVYFYGLTPQCPAWVVGTMEGNDVTLKIGQYLGVTAGYDLELQVLKVKPDFSSFYNVDEFVMIYDPATGNFSQKVADDGDLYFITEGTTSGQIYSYNFNFALTPYDGPKPVIPADPYNVKLYDFHEDSGRNCVYFENTNLGVNGEYMEPENLYYQIYLDDELYTLPTDLYTNISEDLTLIPWNLADGKDIYCNPANHFVYVYEFLVETMGAQIVYFVDDKAYYSNIVSADFDGNQYVTYVNNDITGISEVAAQVGYMEYYDLSGNRLNRPQSGINIIKMTQADGSVKTLKTIVK